MNIKLVTRLFHLDGDGIDFIDKNIGLNSLTLIKKDTGVEKRPFVDGKERVKINCFFDNKGRAIEVYYKRDDYETGKIYFEQSTKKEYQNNYLITKSVKDIINDLHKIHHYRYDESGNINLEILNHEKIGNYYEINYSNSYDSNGKIKNVEIESIEKDNSGDYFGDNSSFFISSIPDKSVEYIYDLNDELVEKIIDDNWRNIEKIKFYNGLIVESIHYLNGKPKTQDKFEYDNNGRLIQFKSECPEDSIDKSSNYYETKKYSEDGLLLQNIKSRPYSLEKWEDYFEYDINDKLVRIKSIDNQGSLFSTYDYSYE